MNEQEDKKGGSTMNDTSTENPKITLGFLTSWVLGIFFLLGAFATLFQSGTMGMAIVSFIIAALLLPPVRKFAHNKTGISLSTGVRIVLFLALLSAGAASIQKTSTSFDVAQAVIKSAQSKGLIVEEFAFERGAYGTRKIVGKLKNTTGRAYTYVQIEFNLYDGAGNTVGSTLANINNLDPDGTWRFEVPVLRAGATKARVKNITSF